MAATRFSTATPRRARRLPRALPLFCALAVVLLAGCVTRPRPPVGPPLDEAAARPLLQALDAFRLDGRVAGAVGEEGFSAQLELQQQGPRARVELRSPLGFGSATVETDGRTVEFRSSRGEHLTGEEGTRALAARLGFDAPLTSLRYWLLGVPDPQEPSSALEAPSGERRFEQLGWRVSAREFASTALGAAAVPVPRRVTLEREPARLRVLVERWHLQ